MNAAEFIALLKEHEAELHGFCRHYYRNSPQDAEDLFQQIVEQLWKSYHRFANRSSFRTWMNSIARKTLCTELRKNKRLKIIYPELLPELGELFDPDNDDQMKKLEKAIRQLDGPEKLMVELYLEKMKYRQMAEVTQVSENAARKRMKKIINRLENFLKRRL